MKLSPAITKLLSRQCGRELTTANDCTVLALDIESRTGDHLGVNTIKRLLGFINDEREPRDATLNIIAHYLGYDNWDTLRLVDEEEGNSGFGAGVDELHAGDLREGARVVITYHPGRWLMLELTHGNSFAVVESENSKLQKGDLITLDHMVQGYPLLVSRVVRAGHDLGSFTAGKAQGINFEIV